MIHLHRLDRKALFIAELCILFTLGNFSFAQEYPPETQRPCEVSTQKTGAAVPAYVAEPEWDFFTILDFNTSAMNMINENHWEAAVFPMTATNQYSCHSYAWYTGRGSLGWEDDYCEQELVNLYSNSIIPFLMDGSFVWCPYSAPGAAAVNMYKNHSAIVFIEDLFISKWGYGPLVLHVAGDDPYESTSDGYLYFCPAY